ncbi:MAG: hypothetical protein V1767_03575 [Chloroflexota bacterium]
MKNITIRGCDDMTHLKMRMLSVGLGKTMPQLLRQMVEDLYNSTDVPDKSRLRKMKRFIKKIKGGKDDGLVTGSTGNS